MLANHTTSSFHVCTEDMTWCDMTSCVILAARYNEVKQWNGNRGYTYVVHILPYTDGYIHRTPKIVGRTTTTVLATTSRYYGSYY
jgi:hypothetical protein